MDRLRCILLNLLLISLQLSRSCFGDIFEHEPNENPDTRIPPGFMPRAVNMEMAWYGISQDIPMSVSSKNLKASRLMTEYTVGRPHIIFRSGLPPVQNKYPRQVLAEKGSKYLRGENELNKAFFKFIREGGLHDGYTVQRVVSFSNDTTLVINKGIFYTCNGTAPLTDHSTKFRPDFKCNHESEAVIEPVEMNLDVCTEAEHSGIDWCEDLEWVMCMGPPDANDTRCPVCTNRLAVPLQEFFDLCTIDENVVIWYEYFGDIPAKFASQQLCTHLNPCTLSYLYRLEAPYGPKPTPRPTTMDPCLVPLCAECVTGGNDTSGGNDTNSLVIDVP